MAFDTYVLQTQICTIISTGSQPMDVYVNGVYVGAGSSQQQPPQKGVPELSDATQRIVDRVKNLPQTLPRRRTLEDASDRVNQPPAGTRKCLPASKEAHGQRAPSADFTSGSSPVAASRSPSSFDRPLPEYSRAAVENHDESDLEFDFYAFNEATAGNMKAQNKRETELARKSFKDAGGLRTKPQSGDDLADNISHYTQRLYINLDRLHTDLNCDQVRSQISRVVDGGIMKRSEFSEIIDCSNTALSNFLKKAGRNEGEKSEVFRNAWVWFKQREIAGLRMPDVRKRLSSGTTTIPKASTPKFVGISRNSAPRPANIPDISGIHLEGEETDEVPIYDTCDEIRRKINAHLNIPGVTQAQFCRDLYQQFNSPKVSGIQTVQLTIFRNKAGPTAGNTSSVFYTAYVFFEKLRIARGEAKSEHRQNMEIIWGREGGFIRKTVSSKQESSGDPELAMDEYGRIAGA